MIDRKHYGILAFPTSQAAAAAESKVLAEGYECRLIPMPEEVSAGCGLVLQVHVGQAAEVDNLLAGNQIFTKGCYEVWFQDKRKSVRRMD